ncbi:MAG: hypothetical protein QXF17_07060 [Ignisphaera sp.]
MLYSFLKDPEVPLYGRAYLEVRTRRLSRYESIGFLERGFSELNYRASREELEKQRFKLKHGGMSWSLSSDRSC